jgi:hypothetical protein
VRNSSTVPRRPSRAHAHSGRLRLLMPDTMWTESSTRSKPEASRSTCNERDRAGAVSGRKREPRSEVALVTARVLHAKPRQNRTPHELDTRSDSLSAPYPSIAKWLCHLRSNHRDPTTLATGVALNRVQHNRVIEPRRRAPNSRPSRARPHQTIPRQRVRSVRSDLPVGFVQPWRVRLSLLQGPICNRGEPPRARSARRTRRKPLGCDTFTVSMRSYDKLARTETDVSEGLVKKERHAACADQRSQGEGGRVAHRVAVSAALDD